MSVLVVEDEPRVRDLIHRELSRRGFTVLQAYDGVSAIRVMEEQPDPVRVALIDLSLPGMSGSELGEILRGTYPTLRILYMSGSSPRDVTVTYMHKPLQMDEVAARLTELASLEAE